MTSLPRYAGSDRRPPGAEAMEASNALTPNRDSPDLHLRPRPGAGENARQSRPHGRSSGVSWEVLVVDNNSSDDTASVVQAPAGRFRFHFTSCTTSSGKSYTLNTGLAAGRSTFVVFTDQTWSSSRDGCRRDAPMVADPESITPGGRFIQSGRRHALGGSIAIAATCGARSRFSTAARRRSSSKSGSRLRSAPTWRSAATLIDSVGGFDPAFGRRGRRCWARNRLNSSAGERAAHAEPMRPTWKLHHHVPASRLTRKYFRRWWLLEGISDRGCTRFHPRSDAGGDLGAAKRVCRCSTVRDQSDGRHVVSGLGQPGETRHHRRDAQR